MINTPVNFGELISAPICALIEGESIAAKASADFIQTIGFQRNSTNAESDLGLLKMVTFQFERPSETTQNGRELATMQVPLLSLIPLPLLQVKNAVLEMAVNITQFSSGKTAKLGTNLAYAQTFLPYSQPQVKVLPQALPTRSSVTNDTTTKVDIVMKVQLVQADLPVGLVKLFSVFDVAMGERLPSPSKQIGTKK